MNEKIDWNFLFSETRARIYLLWAGLTVIGFSAAHSSRKDLVINSFWVILSIVGLGYMYRVMPMRLQQAKRIWQAWFWPITIGLVVSFAAFYVRPLFAIVPYLGSFWLLVMAVGYALNGRVDPPSLWYWLAAGLNVAAAVLCALSPDFQAVQWLVTAAVSGWSMLNLWLFRS